MHQAGVENILRMDFDDHAALHCVFPFWNLSLSKNGLPVADEGGLKLHSFYNPEREAEGLLSNVRPDDCAIVFEGFALGYAVLLAAEKFREKSFVLVEPDPARFFSALCVLDFGNVFSLEKIALAVGSSVEETMKIINQSSVLKTRFVSVPSHTSHAADFFAALSDLVVRNRRKEEINAATTKKFGFLWNRNCIANAEKSVLCDGVDVFKNLAEGIPFLLIAAGPSLNEILPYKDEISKKCVTVAVDTSLRTLLNADFAPDFVILTDPQYYAYRHLCGLRSPSSVLIASQDAYPGVFRFDCRKIVCASSRLPIGRFFEEMCGTKGDLGSGGSVASCAWNFSRLCGAKKIYLSGLDLSFPKKQTHIRGSTFEQAAHSSSRRIFSAETQSLPHLFSGSVREGVSYSGNAVLTDQRMLMFAWWFESRIAECPETRTFSLSGESLHVPGVHLSSLAEFLNEPDVLEKKSDFFRNAEKNFMDGGEVQEKRAAFEKAFSLMQEKLMGIPASDFYAVERALQK